MVEGLKIIALAVAAAVLYGILHDQVTARVCVEYFTVFHPPVFHTDSPTLLGLGWGVIATWWVGLPLGVLAAIAARTGTWPRLSAIVLVWPLLLLLLVMSCAALLAGIAGYTATQTGAVFPPAIVREVLEPQKHAAFMADWWAHNTSYAVGFFGGLILCGWILWRRARPAVAA